MNAIELRVIVQSDDERPGAADRIEATVQRALDLWFSPSRLYVEQAKS